MEISVKDYMERQPNNPKVVETDQFYLWIALRLAKVWDESPWLRGLDDAVRRDVVLAVTGYYQDVVPMVASGVHSRACTTTGTAHPCPTMAAARTMWTMS